MALLALLALLALWHFGTLALLALLALLVQTFGHETFSLEILGGKSLKVNLWRLVYPLLSSCVGQFLLLSGPVNYCLEINNVPPNGGWRDRTFPMPPMVGWIIFRKIYTPDLNLNWSNQPRLAFNYLIEMHLWKLYNQNGHLYPIKYHSNKIFPWWE